MPSEEMLCIVQNSLHQVAATDMSAQQEQAQSIA
jgi:hypothetical protein